MEEKILCNNLCSGLPVKLWLRLLYWRLFEDVLHLWQSLCTRMPDESYHTQFCNLLLCPCDVFPVMTNSRWVVILWASLLKTKQKNVCESWKHGCKSCHFDHSMMKLDLLKLITLLPTLITAQRVVAILRMRYPADTHGSTSLASWQDSLNCVLDWQTSQCKRLAKHHIHCCSCTWDNLGEQMVTHISIK